MKKFLCLVVALTMVSCVFVGCAEKGMKDGTYKAEYSAADDHGWTDYVEITVADGKITAVDYDSVDAEGKKKNGNEWYDNAMKDAGSPTWPSDFMPKLEQSLIDNQDIDKVDTIAGATASSDSFRKLVKELSKNMSKGDTTTVKVSA